MSDLVTVKVRRMHTNDLGNHVEGDTYKTTKQHAALLAGRQIVDIVDGAAKAERAPANKALSGAPENKSGTGVALLTAAEVLKLADGNFLAFKAAAKPLLGDATPNKKADIVAALEALVPVEAKPFDEMSDEELKAFLDGKGVATAHENRDELLALANEASA